MTIRKKNPHAVALGKKGGKKGGLAKVPKGFATMSKRRLAAASKAGVKARARKRKKSL